MKNLVFTIIAIASLCACTKTDTFNTYELKVGESITHTKDLKVGLIKVEDSRCPTDVVCIWEGQAEAFMIVTFEGDQLLQLNLIDRVGFPELADTTMLGFHFKLLEVLPEASSTVQLPQEEYTIRLLIE